MLYRKIPITWAILAISQIQTIHASPLFDMLMPPRPYRLAANDNPTNPELPRELSYCSQLPFRTDRGSLTPPENTPKAIFIAEGQITYACQPPTAKSPLRPENSQPHLEVQRLTADLFDVGSVLKVNRGFAGPFLYEPTASHSHPKGPKVGQMVQKSPAQLPKFVVNGRTFFSPVLVEKIGAPTNVPEGDQSFIDRDWAHYSLKPASVNGGQAVTDLYEVKTVAGQIASPYCVIGQDPVTVPYKAQLWVYGDRKIPGITPDKKIPDACSASRSLFFTGAN